MGHLSLYLCWSSSVDQHPIHTLFFQPSFCPCSLASQGGLDCGAYAADFSAHFGSESFDGYRDVSTKVV